MAISVTELLKGETPKVVRKGKRVKKRYMSKMEAEGFALSFPTKEIEQLKLKTPLDKSLRR